LGIALAISGSQHDPAPQRNLLAGVMAPDQLLKTLPFFSGEMDSGRFRTRHDVYPFHEIG
jgi:hypothetical protein